jgi:hypothetical protein
MQKNIWILSLLLPNLLLAQSSHGTENSCSDPDLHRTFQEIVEANGFAFESHSVIT